MIELKRASSGQGTLWYIWYPTINQGACPLSSYDCADCGYVLGLSVENSEKPLKVILM